MTTNLTRWMLILAAAAQIAFGGVDSVLAKGAAELEAGDGLESTSFKFDHLEPGAAHMLVLEICAEEAKGTCRLLSRPGDRRSGGSVVVAGTPAVLTRIGRALRKRDAVESTQRFQIALVEATTSGPRRLEGLSEGARKALEDASQLLPYKGLELLDVALIETNDRGVTHLTGPGGLDYRVGLEMDAVVSLEGLRLEVDRFELTRQPRFEADREAVPLLNMLRTSLRLKPGETVVVGTSRLEDGDAALIALVTAVASSIPAGGAPR